MPDQQAIYRRNSSMEPLLPESERGILAELTVQILSRTGRLHASLPSKVVRQSVGQLVREMNSYYSNLIEGHKTLPRDIQRALRNDFATDAEQQMNQRLSAAHVQTEHAMRERLAAEPVLDVFSPEFICWLHDQFYRAMPESERFTLSKSGERFPLAPGQLRNYNVEVGRHTPPDHPVLPEYLTRFQSFYADPGIPATHRLIAVAASHHRLAWIHPFGDGNGRVARLQSQAALIRAGVDGDGLWTLSRGLARARSTYFLQLQSADAPRQNDLDGRGNLSDRALAGFCRFFLETVLDQVDFMIGIISPFALVERIETYLRFTRTDLEPRMRERLARLLKCLCLEGELTRGAVPEVLGLKGTAAREVIGLALGEGLITSPSEKGVLQIAFPAEVLEYYFPSLFTDLPVDT